MIRPGPDLWVIAINRNLHHLADKGSLFQASKTTKSRRQVPLSRFTSTLLGWRRDNQRAARLHVDQVGAEIDLAFCQLDGSPLLSRSVSQTWRRLVRLAGFPGICLHDARHTHAALMLEQVVTWKIISERLGHGSVPMTLDVYAHASPGLQNAAGQCFDKVLWKAKNDGETSCVS